MRNLLKIFLIFLIIIKLPCTSFSLEKSISDYVDEYGKAVVLIATIKEKTGVVGLGSGFLVSPSGVIATNYHVIEGAYPAMVKLINGDSYEDILVIDVDPQKDVAIIKIKGWGLPYVKLGDSEATRVGDRVFVIGNPKGLENSVTEGLLSAKRDISELASQKTGFKIHQISAPVSHGSSGSPVFNSKGEVIGIATLTVIGGQNLNFSVPINYVRGLISELPKMSLADFAKRTPDPTFATSVEAIPKKMNLSGLWTSLTGGSDYIIRSDNENLIHIERVIPMEYKNTGIFYKCELRNYGPGSNFIGKCRLGTPCSYYLPLLGAQDKFCILEANMELLSFTENRIEGKVVASEKWDCRTCSLIGSSTKDFVWIRK